MRLFGKGEESPTTSEGLETLPGERGLPSIHRARSLQSRVSSVLAIALMSALGVGLLTWYYARALTHTARVRESAQTATRSRAQADLPLPSLGHIQPPVAAPHSQAPEKPVVEQLLGPPPPLPEDSNSALGAAASAPLAVAPYPSVPKSAGQLALERQLSGPVFAKESGTTRTSESVRNASEGAAAATDLPPMSAPAGSGPGIMSPPASRADMDLATLLRPSVTPAARAQVLPTRRFLLSKGAFIDCTLETAIDSSLPGMTTCITATDTFSTDGQVVLLERGTKLIGETRGQVQPGGSRLFVLWTEARTPSGVVVPLASEGTDELGRAGLSGTVNRHFWERFGAAILVSVINGAVQAGAQSANHGGGTVVLTPNGSQDVMTEILKDTVAMPPTVRKQQGDRIEILVARDLDFRSVYELRTAVAVAGPHKGTP